MSCLRAPFVKFDIGNFSHNVSNVVRSAFQINTSTTFDLSFKNSFIRMLIAERAHHHSANIWDTFLTMTAMLYQVSIAA